MALTSPAVTQIIYLVVPPSLELERKIKVGRKMVIGPGHYSEQSGAQPTVLGPLMEEPENVQLHIVVHSPYIMQEYTANCKALGHAPRMPIGTTIYVGTDEAWEHAWQLWTHVVR
ncbi:hypothetical protein F5Y16DRAFT_394968 [Xylariaceae sp. FL0255]|nr:hypothetical protein F5Y16DRAFT_394968 [Xylariaceae sp. FL0255]